MDVREYERLRDRYATLKKRFSTNPSAVLGNALDKARKELHRAQDQILRERSEHKDRG